jgi:2-furoyl-CoA dehydrogenase 2Fe-2S iron sulfur subunit
LMSLDALLARCAQADEAEIRDVLTGHLCRCTGYASIIKAALEAAAELRRQVDREAVDA